MSQIFLSPRHLLITIFLFVANHSFASPSITTKNICFKISDETYDGQLVLPVGQHSANRLASSLQDKMPDLQLIISDKLMSNHSARGAYVFRQNLLIISSNSASNPSSDPTIQHEITHAIIWNSLRKGQAYRFSGLAFNENDQFQTKNYGRFFGIDEVITTMFSLNLFNNRLKEQLDQLEANSDPFKTPDYRDSVFNLRTYLLRLQTMFSTLNMGLSDGTITYLKQNPPELSFLPVNLEWTQIENPQIKIILPASSKEQLIKLFEYTTKALEEIDKIDSAAFAVDTQRSEPNRQMASREIHELTAQFIDDFSSAFPKEATLLKFNNF